MSKQEIVKEKKFLSLKITEQENKVETDFDCEGFTNIEIAGHLEHFKFRVLSELKKIKK